MYSSQTRVQPQITICVSAHLKLPMVHLVDGLLVSGGETVVQQLGHYGSLPNLGRGYHFTISHTVTQSLSETSACMTIWLGDL